MGLVFLALLLVVPYLALSLICRWSTLEISAPARARVGLTLLFAFAGIGHFVVADEMALMLPPVVPYRLEIIHVTGLLELLGAVAVWIPQLMRLTGLCLFIMLVGVLPANIYSALAAVEFGGHEAGPVYLLTRIPLQFFFMWWTYFATEQHWFRRF